MLVGVAILIGNSIANEWGTLSLAFQDGLADIRQWLADGPLHASDNQISDWIDSLQEALANNQDSLVSGALSTATTAAEVVSGAFLALFATIFFLHDGRGIGELVRRPVPGALAGRCGRCRRVRLGRRSPATSAGR